MPHRSVALIPAYKPDERALEVARSLNDLGFYRILAVSDGNSAEYEPVLSALEAIPNVTLLRHSVNMGKGRALKTAFDYILKTWPGCNAVCVDCDGQLGGADAVRGAQLAAEHPDSLILGCRDLRHTENVPAANRFGNFATRLSLRLLTGVRFADTQCGLRAYPPAVMKQLLAVGGERFEFENNTLLHVRRTSLPIVEYPISVVYEKNEGYTTTFRKIHDSVMIYKNLLSFLTAPTLTYLLSLVLWLGLSMSGWFDLWGYSAVFALALFAGVGLTALVVPNPKRLLLGGGILSLLAGGAVFGLGSLGLLPAEILAALLLPCYFGLCVNFRRLGYGPLPKVLRLKR